MMWLSVPALSTIYFGLFCIGFCYAVRASVAYVFTTESLLSAEKLQFCVYQFSTDGLMQVLMAFLYWSGIMTWRKMLLMNMTATLILIVYILTRLHDSPQYLYSKGKFTDLKHCLANIAKRNGCYDATQIETITERLAATKRQEDEAARSSQLGQ